MEETIWYPSEWKCKCPHCEATNTWFCASERSCVHRMWKSICGFCSAYRKVIKPYIKEI